MTDNDRFCELCNMVFSSHIVAKSHYEGKIHSKNLRKQGQQPQGKFHEGKVWLFSLLQYGSSEGQTQKSLNWLFPIAVTDGHTEVHHLPNLSRDPAVQKTAPECGLDRLALTATTAAPTEVDLKDPDKYCALCALSFNNPQMALQHYNGRKHQKNQSRQKIIKTLRDDIRQGKVLLCLYWLMFVELWYLGTFVPGYTMWLSLNLFEMQGNRFWAGCNSMTALYSHKPIKKITY